jgi:CPA2 family monovalent cation:H+ antiporter-2
MANPETQIVLGITMFEDVFLAVYLSLISGIVLSGASSFTGVLSSGGIALGFIVGSNSYRTLGDAALKSRASHFVE